MNMARRGTEIAGNKNALEKGHFIFKVDNRLPSATATATTVVRITAAASTTTAT